MPWLRTLCLVLLPISCLAASPAEDEAWIERYMGKPGQSAAPAGILPGYKIAWGELGRFVGQSVLVQTENGARRGEIERVEGGRLYMRARMHGGYAELKLRRDQILSTELE